jgi:hypothetical protein
MVMDSVVLELEGQTEGKGPRQNAQNAIPKPESRHGGCRWGLGVEGRVGRGIVVGARCDHLFAEEFYDHVAHPVSPHLPAV